MACDETDTHDAGARVGALDLGLAHLESGECERAIEQLTTAIKLRPRDAMISWINVTLVLAIGLVGLLASGCAPSEPVPAIGPEKVAIPTIEVTPSSEPTATSYPTPTEIPSPIPASVPSPIPTNPPPTATQMPVPSATACPGPTVPSSTPAPEPTPTGLPEGVTITILYDNNEYDERLEAAWGFSCLVEGLEKAVLFDTGGDSAMLLRNMRKLRIAPQDVEAIVISHIHYDHLGGLAGFLEGNHRVTVYLPAYLPGSIKATVRESGAELVEVHEPIVICERAYSTGELGDWIKEQSLVIETEKGLVVITGCAHPGIVNIVREAKRQLKEDVHLVLGGFHLCWMNALQVKSVVDGVKKEGVDKVAPCHCSGDLARRTFEKAYGEDFILVGVGQQLKIESAGR